MNAQSQIDLTELHISIFKNKFGNYSVMKIKSYLRAILTIAAFSGAAASRANENDKNLIYIGGGSADKGNSLKSNETPMAIGYLSIPNSSDSVYGIDFSGEGTKLEFNGGRTVVKQGTSFNFLIGKNLRKSENSRFDAAFLIGMRTASSTCPTSYLGYQCYANEPPKISYEVNYGAVLTMTFNSFMIGARLTGESAQALIGFRF
jgi:hypothetical protein